MCRTAWHDGKDIETPNELRQILGVVVSLLTPDEEKVMRERTALHGADLDDCCLCHTDIPASAEAAGWAWDYDGCGGYELTPRNQREKQ